MRQPEWWASNFYGDGKMNNYNQRAGDLWDPPTQTVSFARNSTSNTRLQGMGRDVLYCRSCRSRTALLYIRPEAFVNPVYLDPEVFVHPVILTLCCHINSPGNPVW